MVNSNCTWSPSLAFLLQGLERKLNQLTRQTGHVTTAQILKIIQATLKAWLENTDNETQHIHSRRKSLSANDNRLPYPMMCAHAPVWNRHKEKTHASDLVFLNGILIKL